MPIEQVKGAQARLVLDYETSFGSNPATANGIILPFNTYTVSKKQSLIDSKTIVSHGNPTEPGRGRITVDGKATFPFCYRTIGHILKMILGAPTTTGTTPTYTHTYKIDKTKAMPSAVIEKGFIDLGQYFLQNGVKFGGFSFNYGEDAELEISVDTIMAATESTGTSAYDSDAASIVIAKASQFQASLKEGGSTIAIVKSGSINVNRNLDGSNFVVSTTNARASIPESVPSVTGSLKAIFKDMTLVNKAMAGTKTSLELKFEASASQSVTFTFPEIIYETPEIGINGPAGIELDFNWRGFYASATEATSAQVVLINDTASY